MAAPLDVLLGGFRAVLSLLLTVMLLALGVGALLGGWIERRFGHPARTLIIVQGVFAAPTLVGLASNTAEGLAAHGTRCRDARHVSPARARSRAVVQRSSDGDRSGAAVARRGPGVSARECDRAARAGRDRPARRLLYAANTVGAVTGSLIAGYVLLPWVGMQGAATFLAGVAALAIGPLSLVSGGSLTRRPVIALAAHLSPAREPSPCG